MGEYGKSLEINNLYEECGSIFTLKRAEVKNIPEDASREKQEGIQGQWQQESPLREILEHVRGNRRYGMWHPNDAARVTYPNEGRQLGRVQRKIQG